MFKQKNILMKILIVPTIREIHKNQLEYCLDLRLVNLFQKTFINSKIEIYNDSIKDHFDLVVFSGGNSSSLQKKKNKIRNKHDNKIYNFAVKNKIKILGICHGAQFLAKKFKFKLEKKKNHIGKHEVFFNINNVKFKRTVNSFHNYSILIKNSKVVKILAIAQDKTVEAFYVRNKKILGIMWHPERYEKIKKFDQKLLREFYGTNSTIGWKRVQAPKKI